MHETWIRIALYKSSLIRHINIKVNFIDMSEN